METFHIDMKLSFLTNNQAFFIYEVALRHISEKEEIL